MWSAFPAVTAAETALAAAVAAAEAAAAALNNERTPLHSKDVPKSFTSALRRWTCADLRSARQGRRDAIEAVAEEAADQRQELTMQLKAKLETLLSSMSTQ